jgi:hypothetical protein
MTKKGSRADKSGHEEAILKLWEAYNLIADNRRDVRVFVRTAIVGLAEKEPAGAGSRIERPPL